MEILPAAWISDHPVQSKDHAVFAAGIVKGKAAGTADPSWMDKVGNKFTGMLIVPTRDWNKQIRQQKLADYSVIYTLYDLNLYNCKVKTK